MFPFPEYGNNELEMQDGGRQEKDLAMDLVALQAWPVASSCFWWGFLTCLHCAWASWNAAFNSSNHSTQSFPSRSSVSSLQPRSLQAAVSASLLSELPSASLPLLSPKQEPSLSNQTDKIKIGA